MKKSIRTKIIVLLMFLLGILAVCSLVVYKISMNNIYEISEESVDTSIEQVRKDINKILTEARKMAYLIAQDSDMQVALRSDLPTQQQELYKVRRNFNYALSYTGKLNENIQGIFVIGENGSIYRSVSRTLYKQDYRQEEWYLNVMQNDKDYWIAPHPGSFIVHNLYDPVISLAIPIRDRISYRNLGVVVVDVAVSSIQGLDDKETLFNGETYLTSGHNEIIYCADFENLNNGRNQNISDAIGAYHQGGVNRLQDIWIEKEHRLLYGASLGISDWKLFISIGYDNVMGNARRAQETLLWTIFICFVLSLILSFVAAQWISDPLKKVRASMSLVENGDFSVRISSKREDEIGGLINSFNVMTAKIEEMTRREQENQEMLLKAELSALQAQINPHFLYNTLDSINWMVRMNRLEEVNEMIDSLITLFRISLSKGKTFITIGDELSHVEKYFQIQKIRYSRILNYEIDVPQQINDYMTIKMILQPLVENAIYHGLKEKGEPGWVRISAEENEDNIIFCVADTGLGMKEDKKEELMKMMKEEKEYHSDSYGIINVQKRIKTYFGPQCGLSVESKYQEGTKVFITIPKRKEIENHVGDGDCGR